MSGPTTPLADDPVALRVWATLYRHFATTLFDRRAAAEAEHWALEYETAAAQLEAARRTTSAS